MVRWVIRKIVAQEISQVPCHLSRATRYIEPTQEDVDIDMEKYPYGIKCPKEFARRCWNSVNYEALSPVYLSQLLEGAQDQGPDINSFKVELLNVTSSPCGRREKRSNKDAQGGGTEKMSRRGNLGLPGLPADTHPDQ
jgi:hypothetical protein